MNESIREWYKKTTKKSMLGLVWAGVLSSIGAILFYVLVPKSGHLSLQIFNGAITIPVAGGIWIVSFILMWLVPMRETAFRSQESMERMESRFKDLQVKAESAIGKVETAADKVNKLLDEGLAERLEDHIQAIRAKIDRETKPLEAPQRRPRPGSPGLDLKPVPKVDFDEVRKMEDALLSLEEIERTEDVAHDANGTGD